MALKLFANRANSFLQTRFFGTTPSFYSQLVVKRICGNKWTTPESERLAALGGRTPEELAYNDPQYGKEYTSEVSMPTTLGESVGSLRFEMLSHMIGENDPFEMRKAKIRPNSQENPNLVASPLHRRMMACICHPEQNNAHYQYMFKNLPIRCKCGHWFKLVDPDVYHKKESKSRADWISNLASIPAAKAAYDEALTLRDSIKKLEAKQAALAKDSAEGKKLEEELIKIKDRDLELETVLDDHYFGTESH